MQKSNNILSGLRVVQNTSYFYANAWISTLASIRVFYAKLAFRSLNGKYYA